MNHLIKLEGHPDVRSHPSSFVPGVLGEAVLVGVRQVVGIGMLLDTRGRFCCAHAPSGWQIILMQQVWVPIPEHL